MWPPLKNRHFSFNAQNIIATTISVAALFLLVITFYLTTLRQTERVDVLVTKAPEIVFDENDIKLDGEIRVSFVNNGTNSSHPPRPPRGMWLSKSPLLI